MRDLYRSAWAAVALVSAACGGPPVLYENPKHSIAVQVPGGAGAPSEFEGVTRPDICAGPTLSVTWYRGGLRTRLFGSAFGFSVFTCRLRQPRGVDELLQIEKASFEAKGGVTESGGSGSIDGSVDGSVSRLAIKVIRGRMIMAMVVAQKQDALYGPEATLFLESVR